MTAGRPPNPKKYTINLYTPHAGQLLLHNNTTRFRIMCCGRRFGKTLACTNELAKKALEKPASLNWWIAPTYRQTEIAFNLLSDALQPVLAKPPNRSKMRLDLINDSTIECRSAERYENMRGDGPSFVIFDEASKCPKAAWTEVVRPSLADNAGGAIFISTPWGRDWFYELFERGQDPSETEYWSASFPTAANPFIPPEEIEEARRTLPEMIFSQEFLALFLQDAASVFHHIENCVGGELSEMPQLGHEYVIGWDVAKYNDYSVVSVIDCNTGQLVAFQRFNGIDYREQIDEVIVPISRRYNGAMCFMDCTGVGDPVMEELRRKDVAVEGYYFTNQSKKKLIDNAVVAVERRYIRYPHIPVLLNEMRAFSYKITKSNNIIYSAPEGQKDDCVISLALATHGAKRGSTIPFEITSANIVKPSDEVLPVQKIDDAFIMARQQQIARSLAWVKSPKFETHTKIPVEDNGWGIA